MILIVTAVDGWKYLLKWSRYCVSINEWSFKKKKILEISILKIEKKRYHLVLVEIFYNSNMVTINANNIYLYSHLHYSLIHRHTICSILHQCKLMPAEVFDYGYTVLEDNAGNIRHHIQMDISISRYRFCITKKW